MYEIDGIVYAGHPKAAKRVIYAEYIGNHMISIAYNTGEVVHVDFTQHFDGKAFSPLKDEATLRSFTVERGTLTWLDGEIDVAPEYLLDVGRLIEEAV